MGVNNGNDDNQPLSHFSHDGSSDGCNAIDAEKEHERNAVNDFTPSIEDCTPAKGKGGNEFLGHAESLPLSSPSSTSLLIPGMPSRHVVDGEQNPHPHVPLCRRSLGFYFGTWWISPPNSPRKASFETSEKKQRSVGKEAVRWRDPLVSAIHSYSHSPPPATSDGDNDDNDDNDTTSMKALLRSIVADTDNNHTTACYSPRAVNYSNSLKSDGVPNFTSDVPIFLNSNTPFSQVEFPSSQTAFLEVNCCQSSPVSSAVSCGGRPMFQSQLSSLSQTVKTASIVTTGASSSPCAFSHPDAASRQRRAKSRMFRTPRASPYSLPSNTTDSPPRRRRVVHAMSSASELPVKRRATRRKFRAQSSWRGDCSR